METKKKADLHMHPSFYSPQSGEKVPNLKQIVDQIFISGLDICSISACHPAPRHLDRRFHDYMNQLPSLERDFEIDYHAKEGFLRLRRRLPLSSEASEVVILNSQEVRTDCKGMPADINVLGVQEFIEAGKDIGETAEMARDEGGIVTVCHPESRCGAGMGKSLDLLYHSQVDGIEGWDATENIETNSFVSRELDARGIKGIAVSDAHHYKQMGSAYSLFDIIGDFSMYKLRDLISKGEFESTEGQVGFFSKHLYHTVPILASIPRHTLRTPKQLIRTLLKRK